MSDRRHPLVEALVALVVVVGVLLAAWQWKAIFADWGFLLPTAIATVAVAAVAIGSNRLGWARPYSVLASAAVTAVTLVPLYAGDVADLPSDLINSWKGLASTGLLIPTEPEFVLVPVVVAAAGSWLGVDLMVRRGSAAPAVLAMVAVHAVAVAYSVSQRQPSVWLAVALMALAVVLLGLAGVLRPGGEEFAEGERPLSARQLVGPVAVATVLAALAGGLTWALDRDDAKPFDLRDWLASPLDITETATPLARVKAGLVDTDDSTVFTIRLDGLGAETAVDLLPVAVLDRYDGSIWSTSATFEPAGSVLPTPSESAPLGPEVRQTVSLTSEYPFRFLPRAGTVRTLVGDNLAWDTRVGSVAMIDESQTSYESDVALLASMTDPGATAPTTRVDSAAGSTSSAKAELTDDQRRALSAYLGEAVAANAEPLAQLRALETDLADVDFGYNTEAPAGHSLAALVSYLAPGSTEQSAGAPAARVGFAEHSAASFALLARELGVPSRVVVGYQLEEPITASAPEAIVSNNDIHAWPEAWFPELGWVRFEPTNKANQTNDEATRTPSVSSAGVDADRTDLPEFEDPILLADEPVGGERSNWWWLALVALLPLLYLVLVTLGKAVRRRRRRSRAADHRIAGAWRETRDRFGELGLPADQSLSATDIADELDYIDLRDLGDSVAAMAPAIDTALYAPHAAADTEADTAWESADTAIKLARRSASVGTRAKARLDPRALFRR